MYPPVLATLAGCMAETGQAEEALVLLETALRDKIDLAGGRYNAFYFPKYQAVALTRAGRKEEAILAATRACAAATRYEQHGHHAEALTLLGELEAACARDGEAIQHLHEAHALAAPRDMELLVQRIQTTLEHIGRRNASAGIVPLASGHPPRSLP